MAKTSILIGVCSTRDDKDFKESYCKFTNEICEDYCISTMRFKNKILADAQNILAKFCVENYYPYILLLDDDHSGHTKEMLECLINANAYMATIKAYSRHYPYVCTLMKKSHNTYIGIENGQGYQECDLTGFPMTLIKRELFLKLEEPYFRSRNDGGRDWATDREFCERIATKGVRPVGCFQHCLPHQGIDESNVKQKRYQEILKNNNAVTYKLFKDRQKNSTRGVICTERQQDRFG